MQQNHSVLPIFPPVKPRPEKLQDIMSRDAAFQKIRQDPEAWAAFQGLEDQDKETIIDFCVGARGLKVTYDPFFKYVFSPKRQPERLNSLLSCILNQKVIVWSVLPQERSRISESSSLVVMDLLVQLNDGRLVNVEMQRIGYHFPIERGFCYASDLLMRQYDKTKAAMGKDFSYRSLKPIYVIVLMEKSPSPFWTMPGRYIHRSLFSFDTGLAMHSLQNFIFISLDIFREIPHNNSSMTDLEAWLYFFSSDDSTDILNLVQRDLDKGKTLFQNLYHDIANFRFKPKELITMYSEALSIMDRNTVTYMINEMKESLQQKDVLLQREREENQQLRKQLELLRQQNNLAEP